MVLRRVIGQPQLHELRSVSQNKYHPDIGRHKPEEQNPYQNEWNDLLDAIRDDKPYNEAARGVEASIVSNMGRMAAHTGREITFDEMLQCEHEMAPGVDKLTMDSPAPLQAAFA